jgi:hypothetical protein
MFFIYIIIILLLIILFFINNYLNSIEYFCYGNDFCNGNKINSLCINQKCHTCGLVPSCNKDSDCDPNLCINGCCDTL